MTKQRATRKKPPGANSKGRRKPAEREKLTVYIDQDVLTSLRLFCARSREELSVVTTNALRKFLGPKA